MGWKRLATMSLALLVVVGTGPAGAVATQQAGPTPPRLSFMDGEVSFWRPGAEDWAPAKVNTPLAAGDSLYTGDAANLELQVGPGAFVRAGAGTELGLESLESGIQQFKLTAGHAAVDARRLPKGQAIEIDTPNGAFTIDHPGYYRIDVDDTHTTFSTRRGGQATLVPANGEATDVGADKQIVLEGTDTPQLTSAAAPAEDDWDRWNLGRGEHASAPSRSAQYVPPDVAGSGDLDEYGDWRETPSYGHVWVPRQVASDWSPYSTGRWVWDPYYGWSWVDDAPWGWAPYHYGRWVNTGGYWGWAPGPIVAAPVYSPALVAFFGPQVSVSVGLPFVSWVPLGWGEPIIPWWGPVGFVGTCWWGGWGGPRFVNNVVVQKNVYVNVRNVNVYRNQRVNNAMVSVNRDHFGRGRVEHVRLTGAQARELRPVRGQLGVKPTQASLVAKEGRGLRPPQAVNARPVVATRPPQDVSRRLQSAGLKPGASAAPPPRIANSPQQHGAGREASLERRTTPPPPPGMAGRRQGRGAPGASGQPHQTHVERPGLGTPQSSASAPRKERPDLRAPRAPGGNQPTADVPRRSEGTARGTQPPPTRQHVERPAAPPTHQHVERPAAPPASRGAERAQPQGGRAPTQFGAPPSHAPHERNYTPKGEAPKERPHLNAPGASPSARMDAPRLPAARSAPGRVAAPSQRATRAPSPTMSGFTPRSRSKQAFTRG